MQKYIKSPLNYIGGKHKLLPQILPLFPKNINTFYDVFGGGFNVGINVEANKVVYSDTERPLQSLFQYFQSNTYEDVVVDIEGVINKYNLSQSNIFGYEHYGCDSSKGLGLYNKNKYLRLRSDYNGGYKEPYVFYTMILYAFNNMIRFNNKGEFNVAVNKRDFNNSIRKNLKNFIKRLHSINVHFKSEDFRNIDMDRLTGNDFVYCDPPYLITTANYNENGGWTEQDELDLFNLLDILHSKNIRFALSNVFESKGKSNDLLKEWSKKYNVYHLNVDYSNCNYQTKDKSKNSTVEVLITNY